MAKTRKVHRRRSHKKRTMKGGLNWSKYQAPKEPTSTLGQATYGLRNMASRAKFMVTPSNSTKESFKQATYAITPSQGKKNWFSRKLGFRSQPPVSQ